MKHTKIVVTLSDKRCQLSFLNKLYKAGMNVIRINTAHQSTEGAVKIIENARKVSEKIAIMIDTKGPEIRTTRVEEEVLVKKGEKIKVTGDANKITCAECIYVSYEDFEKHVAVGKRILINDGDVELKVIKVFKTHLLCEVKNSGLVGGRKGINVPGVSFKLPTLNQRDKKYLQFAIKHDVDFIAHSFVRSKEDVLKIKRILQKNNGKIKIISKIENKEGVDNIDEIIHNSYGIMVARGDLGLELSAEKIPAVQKMIIKKCITQKKPVIVATQMLHSMIQNPRPTRAEVNDVAGAVYDQTDAVMLSGETAYGKYPVESVRTMARIAEETEKSFEKTNDNIAKIDNEISVFLADCAVKACDQLPVKAIVTDTMTGKTALYLAAFRGKIPVYAQCYNKTVMRQLALSYSIKANYLKLEQSTDKFEKNTAKLFLKKKYLKEN
ncbi:MAG: pyruvate kinase, partial [archaeon]